MEMRATLSEYRRRHPKGWTQDRKELQQAHARLLASNLKAEALIRSTLWTIPTSQ